jgi:multicomponent Na+:H+ antiporter subunit B
MRTFDTIKRLMILAAIGFVGNGLFEAFVLDVPEYGRFSMDYYLQNTLPETGSQNLVTGIYLNYRLFDSLFEAATLFVVTAGILFMGRKDEEIR